MKLRSNSVKDPKLSLFKCLAKKEIIAYRTFSPRGIHAARAK